MEDKPLTDSINKQYSKYGSLRTKEKESKIELCNSEDPLKFLTRIDSSIKDAKARVKKSIDNSSISEEYYYDSSYDQCLLQAPSSMSSDNNLIPMIKLDRLDSKKQEQPIATTSDESSTITATTTTEEIHQTNNNCKQGNNATRTH